jgi:mono/diheme cytochrome c family protein
MRKSKKATLFLLVVLIACKVNPYQEGGRLYKVHCENCHMQDGKGLRGLIPPLANSDYLVKNKEKIPCIIKYGIKGPIIVNDTTYNTEMAAIPELTDVQINNILNYISFEWNNGQNESNINDVKQALQNCQ